MPNRVVVLEMKWKDINFQKHTNSIEVNQANDQSQ